MILDQQLNHTSDDLHSRISTKLSSCWAGAQQTRGARPVSSKIHLWWHDKRNSVCTCGFCLSRRCMCLLQRLGDIHDQRPRSRARNTTLPSRRTRRCWRRHSVSGAMGGTSQPDKGWLLLDLWSGRIRRSNAAQRLPMPPISGVGTGSIRLVSWWGDARWRRRGLGGDCLSYYPLTLSW
ncbi:hypothetical protein BC827DRAFT_627211 [Russula dissimulans]|nr:hypothetical protein BC827DRAFT_627211 [Russula dissimulans]